jgi:hypothetical protein
VKGVIFPSTVGAIVNALSVALAGSDLDYSKNIVIQPELPDAKSGRMITVRDDSGSDDGTQTRRRAGVNVWAEDAPTAELLALLSMAILRNSADGKPITSTDSFSGPAKVYDSPPYEVGGRPLAHYFFSFRLTARGSDF